MSSLRAAGGRFSRSSEVGDDGVSMGGFSSSSRCPDVAETQPISPHAAQRTATRATFPNIITPTHAVLRLEAYSRSCRNSHVRDRLAVVDRDLNIAADSLKIDRRTVEGK